MVNTLRYKHSRAAAIVLMLLYIVVIILPVIVSLLTPSPQGVLYESGRAAALAGAAILLLQPLLAGRFKCISAPFGLDNLIRFHRSMAVLATGLVVLHPLLLVAGEATTHLLTSLKVPWYIWAGKLALLLLVVNVSISLFRKRLNLSFEQWRLLHDLLGPMLLILIFLHSWSAGADFASSSLLSYYWALLFAVGMLAFLYHRLVRPRLAARSAYKVTAVEQEAPRVWTVSMAPPAGKGIFPYFPGQFHFVHLIRNRNLPAEEHHWTISSSPVEGGIVQSTIKEVGDFTGTIKETQPGDHAIVQGAFGRFSYVFHPNEEHFVFVAGGIGITPLMSMLRTLRENESEKKVTLFYNSKTENEIVFREELDEMAVTKFPDIKVIYILSRPSKEWKGERGHVSVDMIGAHVTIDDNRNGFYLSGPEPMRRSLISDLRARGVSKRKIHIEKFAFVD